MKTAILYICTGKYTIFWETFYRSCEKYFLSSSEKDYFIFTDGVITFDNNDDKRIHRIEQKNLGWPGNTLFRFRMFWDVHEQFASFDYVFFFNANCEFLAPVGHEFLPSQEEEITVVQHPGFYNKIPDEFTYDRNKKSRAYIAFGEGSIYVCGGINGGHTKYFLALINSLRIAIDEDDKNNIIALWHDESHLNKYILNHPYKLLPSSFCYPEGWDIPFDKIIMVRDKSKYGRCDELRGLPYKKRSILSQIKGKIRKIWK